MILEVAILDVRADDTVAFERAFAEAETIIASMPGFHALEFHKCVEQQSRYLLLVQWRSVEDHTEGFRKSPHYQRWKALLHHFYDPFPTVEHYQIIQGAGRRPKA